MKKRNDWVLIMLAIMLGIIFIVGFGWRASLPTALGNEPATQARVTTTQAIYTNQKIVNTITNYPTLKNVLTTQYKSTGADRYVMPGINATSTINSKNHKQEICTTMTPQGITEAGNYLIASAYDHDRNHNSVLYVIDRRNGKLLKTVILQGQPHVGGVDYDPINQQVWVCSRSHHQAELIAIRLKTINEYSAKSHQPIHYAQRVRLASITRASFVTYADNHLYVGFFNAHGSGNIQKFILTNGGNLKTKSSATRSLTNLLSILDLPLGKQKIIKQVQGMAFYKDYVIMSQSYGPKSSRILVFKNRHKSVYRQADALATYTAPSHLEQVTTTDGRLWMNFESAARAYRDTSNDVIDRLLIVDLPQFKRVIEKKVGVQK